MPDPSPDWSFTFTDHPDGTTESSARPSRELDASERAAVSELRAEAERLEQWHHGAGAGLASTVASDLSDPMAHVDRVVQLARRLHQNGRTADEIASAAGLSVTALRRWLDPSA